MPVSEFSHLPEVTRLGSGGVPNPGVAGTSVLNHNLLPPLPMHKRLENQLETSRWLGWAALGVARSEASRPWGTEDKGQEMTRAPAFQVGETDAKCRLVLSRCLAPRGRSEEAGGDRENRKWVSAARCSQILWRKDPRGLCQRPRRQ